MFKTLFNRLQLAWLNHRAAVLTKHQWRERALHRMHMAQLRAERDAVALRADQLRKVAL